MTPINCLLIGNGSLLVRCGDQLREAGARLVLAVTENPAVERWAAAIGLPAQRFDPALPGRVGPGSVDYVFSIGNLRVLSPEWLRLARRLTVNFHDGPLPEYRGLHVTTWALLNRERRHGVSWHLAEPEVDTGDILEEERFDLAADETALTLNARCYDAGAQAFARLVDAIRRDGVVARTPAAGAATRYYGRTRRPPAAGYVDWTRPIEECDALVRALDFGPYPNPLCTPWSLRDSQVVRVDAATVAEVRAGTGAAFEPVAADLRQRITACHEAWCDGEREWAEQCLALQPLPLTTAADPAPQREIAAFPLGESLSGQPLRAAAAILVWLGRAFDLPSFDVGYRGPVLDRQLAGLERWFESLPPVRVTVPLDARFGAAVEEVMATLTAQDSRGTFLHDVVRRVPELRGRDEGSVASELRVAVTIGDDAANRRDVAAALVVHLTSDGRLCEWRGHPGRLPVSLAALQARCDAFLRAAPASSDLPLWQIPIVTPDERERLLAEWNPPPSDDVVFRPLTEQFATRARLAPGATAVVTWRERWSYGDLDRRASQVACGLRQRGIGRGAVVGLHLDRSVEMLAALLGVLKTGAAYLPLDPTYPPDRLGFMLDDSAAALVLTQSHLDHDRPDVSTPFIPVELLAEDPSAPPDAPVTIAPSDLAYLIYTSGSTGRPKGVMVEHGNVTSFFAAMDSRIAHDPPGVWLAVSSLSFDISVLELLWTVCRGFTVVLQQQAKAAPKGPSPAADRAIDLSLFYFASDESSGAADRYRLLLEGARFADRHGFEAVWTPERHFHAFGGLYPNPAITSAAIAAITERVGIRAGSVVVPLHHPVRVAEDWSLVDNLSNGRVGVAFASGWHPNDFVLAPHQHARAKQVTFEHLAIVRRLWRGESVALEGPHGREVAVRTLPRPVQPELPFWITAAGNPETFQQAGQLGGNVLTHLLGQTLDEVAEKIRAYREARRAAGHAGDGQVTLMVHTFVGPTDGGVRDIVRAPMKQYLGSALNLVKQHAWSFPAFKGRATHGTESTDELFRDLSAEDLDGLLEYSFGRYFDHGGLFGSIDTCAATIERFRAAGVDEIACLIDFGVPTEVVLSSLEALSRLRQRVAGRHRPADGEPTVAEAILQHEVTHLQCTPSMASLLLADAAGPTALGRLRHLLVGGEALPAPLAARLRATGTARVTNMYGPTETTVWSITHDLAADESPVPIGRPIDRTLAFVCDARGELVPIGSEGELYLGGPGVARGYHGHPQLTADRFVVNRFGASPAGRLYRTGDRVRFRPDGVLDFLGRSDQQIKLRGHRIELGEVEAALRGVAGVRDAAAVLREDAPGDHRIVGYVTPLGPSVVTEAACREALRARLPAVMVPTSVVVIDALPETPNGKIDRKALPAPTGGAIPPAPPTAPSGEMQQQVADIWRDVLRLDVVGVDDNFFDLGGHSLLTIEVAHRLGEVIGRALPITDLFRFPTIRTLARHLSSAPSSRAGLRAAADRAAARQSARSRRHDR
jgi:natural product biosynthesis luciferase-like monooxygenase protein